MKWKIFILILGLFFIINSVSALESPFATNKIYEKNDSSSLSDFLKIDFNSEYGAIKLSKTFFWILTDKIAEYSLIENTDYCDVDCYAKGKATLYQEGVLFDTFNFYNLYNLNEGKDIQYKLYINDKINKETGDVLWKEYKNNVLPSGDYYWKVEGTKNIKEDVEWIATAFGKDFDEWTDWSSFTWTVNNTVNASLPDIGDALSKPSVFIFNNNLYMIAGEQTGGNFWGFSFNGTNWTRNSTINASLPSVGSNSAPSVFILNNSLYLISGNKTGSFFGFSFNGTNWNVNSSIINGLVPYSTQYIFPNVFYKQNDLFMIVGNQLGTFNGYFWNGTGWNKNSTINASLGDIGDYANPMVFNDSSDLYMLAGTFAGQIFGFYFNGTGWNKNSTINASLPIISNSAPAVFYRGGKFHLLVGKQNAQFNGYTYNFASDTTKPQWSLNSTNSTTAGTSIEHRISWTDETALAGYIFSFDNGTGTLVNDSYIAMIGTTNWSNVSKIINSTIGSTIRWSVCANDSSNNQNCSFIFTYTATSSSSCTCPSANTNWVIAMTDYCNITSACNLGTGNLSFTGAGYCNISNTVTTNKLWNANLSNGATVWLYKTGGIINLV